MSSYNQEAIVDYYTNEPSATVISTAKVFNIKDPTVISTILKLNGVKLRQGNNNAANNLTPEARLKGLEVRQAKALNRSLTKLVEAHGLLSVREILDIISTDGNMP